MIMIHTSVARAIRGLSICMPLALMGAASHAHSTDAHAKPAAGKAKAKEQQAWGIAGDAKAAQRTIAVTMGDDMRFTPQKITVRTGETVRFSIKNRGQMLHEFVIGTPSALSEHAALMLKFPNMEHSEPYMAHVAPGRTGSIVWTFNRPGNFEFACLIAGHYQAGMKGDILVAPAGVSTSTGAKPIAAVAPTAAVAASQAVLPTPAAAATKPMAAHKDMTEAEVKAINRDTKKVTLKHGPIKNLDMPGMTMVFQVADVQVLEKLTVGAKVRFTAEQINGANVITTLGEIATKP